MAPDSPTMQSAARGLLFFLAFGVAAYVMFAYGLMPLGALVHPDMRATFLSHATAIYLHAFASITALVLGPFQFSSSSWQRRPNLHRWAGRLYPI